MTTFPADLVERFRQFKTGDFSNASSSYATLAEHGQSPEVMIISCCDSRVTPEAIFAAGPGDLFVVRNVANLVPPHLSDNSTHGVSAALEFAVLNLKIKHIVVMGHAKCGGVAACLAGGAPVETPEKYIANWVALLNDTRDRVREENQGANDAELQQTLQYEGVKMSLENLRSFPFIKDLEASGELQLHGAFFDIGTGDLQALDPATGKFSAL